MGQIDYAKIARQHGGIVVDEPSSQPVDYAAIARQHGGAEVRTEAPQAQAPRNPIQALAAEIDTRERARTGDVGTGANKGLATSLFGLGKLVRDYTPIGRISDAIQPGAFDQRPPELEPTNAGQRIGFTGEQVGEFFLPTGAVGKVPRAIAEVGKAGGLTLAQTGSPATAGVSMGITAAVPGAGAFVKAGQKLKQGAEKTVVQALGPTKEWAKSEAAKIAPEMLARGVKGSRGAMLEQASGQVGELGPKIGEAVAAAASEGKTISGDAVRGALEFAKRDLTVTSAQGSALPIEGTQAAVKTLDRLSNFIGQLGPEIPIDKANTIKQAWQKIVSKAGFYGPKATASATDNAKAWATREAERSMRRLIADQSPDLAALNKEFSFWKGLEDVLTATELRKKGQGAGLTAAIGGAAGFVSAQAQGDSALGTLGQMVAGGVAGRQVIKLMQSPQWQTMVSAPLKNKLADALLSGKVNQIQDTARIVVTSLPARLRPQP